MRTTSRRWAAVAVLDRAVALDSSDPHPWEMRARAHMNAGVSRTLAGADPRAEIRAAIADAESAIALSPDWPDALLCRGGAHLDLGDALARLQEDAGEAYALAVRDLERVLHLSPGHAIAAQWLALARQGSAAAGRGK